MNQYTYKVREIVVLLNKIILFSFMNLPDVKKKMEVVLNFVKMILLSNHGYRKKQFI